MNLLSYKSAKELQVVQIGPNLFECALPGCYKPFTRGKVGNPRKYCEARHARLAIRRSENYKKQHHQRNYKYKNAVIGRVCESCLCNDSEAKFENTCLCRTCHRQIRRVGRCSCRRAFRKFKSLGKVCSSCENLKILHAVNSHGEYNMIQILLLHYRDDRERVIHRGCVSYSYRPFFSKPQLKLITSTQPGPEGELLILTASKQMWKQMR